MALSLLSNAAEMQKEEAEMNSPKKGGGGGGGFDRAIVLQPGKVDPATIRDRHAADAAIWSLVNDALAAPLPVIEYTALSDEHVAAMQNAADRQKSLLGAS
jgi:hypothetical protein